MGGPAVFKPPAARVLKGPTCTLLAYSAQRRRATAAAHLAASWPPPQAAMNEANARTPALGTCMCGWHCRAAPRTRADT